MSDSYNDDTTRNQYFAKKLIQELQPVDTFVQLVGYARNKNQNDEFYLDDTTGKVHIRELPEESPAIQEGNLYRILGKYELDGSATPFVATQIIQDMDQLDFELYMQAYKKFKEIS